MVSSAMVSRSRLSRCAAAARREKSVTPPRVGIWDSGFGIRILQRAPHAGVRPILKFDSEGKRIPNHEPRLASNPESPIPNPHRHEVVPQLVFPDRARRGFPSRPDALRAG